MAANWGWGETIERERARLSDAASCMVVSGHGDEFTQPKAPGPYFNAIVGKLPAGCGQPMEGNGERRADRPCFFLLRTDGGPSASGGE